VTNPTTPAPADFRFDYAAAQTKGITVAQLDQLASFVFGGVPVNPFTAAIAGIRLVIALAYVWVREKLVAEQMQVQKQQYELAQAQAATTQANDPTPKLPGGT
jgi:hypothetical protein